MSKQPNRLTLFQHCPPGGETFVVLFCPNKKVTIDFTVVAITISW